MMRMKTTPMMGATTSFGASHDDPEELYHSLRAKAMGFLANEGEELARGVYVPNLGAEAAGVPIFRSILPSSWICVRHDTLANARRSGQHILRNSDRELKPKGERIRYFVEKSTISGYLLFLIRVPLPRDTPIVEVR